MTHFYFLNPGRQIVDIKNAFRFDIYENIETGELSAGQFRKQLSEKLNISLPDAGEQTFENNFRFIYAIRIILNCRIAILDASRRLN